MRSKVFVGLALLFIFIISIAQAQENEFFYQDKVPFGASKSDIKEAFSGIEFKEDHGAVITGSFQISTYICNVSFLAPNDSLAIIQVEYSGKNDVNEAYDRLRAALVERYGEASEDQTQMIKILSDPSIVGLVLEKNSKIDRCTNWVLDNVEIAIFTTGKKVEILYNPKNLLDILTKGGL